jgi:hypothetical protein
MSANEIQTPENCPEESIQHSELGESLKSKSICKQLKFRHAPDQPALSRKLYKPTYIPLYTEFYLNTFGTSFACTKF